MRFIHLDNNKQMRDHPHIIQFFYYDIFVRTFRCQHIRQ